MAPVATAPARERAPVPRRPLPRRVAVLSVHTGPLDAPGSGDAGGLNTYVVQTARRMARLGVEVDVFTRATSSRAAPVVELAPGVRVRHVEAGPFEGLAKDELPSQLCAFTAGVLHAEASHRPGWFDAVHSHYWLAGQVGFLVAERWGVPLVHTAHTLAAVKNATLAAGDTPEPRTRLLGERQVVAAADRLVANTAAERDSLVRHYDADPGRVVVVPPGVDLEVFRPGDATVARAAVGVPPDARVVLQVGRVQPLKAPDVLVRATAALLEREPHRRDRLLVVVCGGQSGGHLDYPGRLRALAVGLGVDDVVRFEPPVPPHRLAQWYRAADVVAVPSHSESFGLVALEAAATGTPVLAADVGGLPVAVADGVSGRLLSSRDPAAWARALADLLDDGAERERLGAGGLRHAAGLSWERTTTSLLCTYRDAMAERGVVPDEPRAGDAALARALPC